MFVICDLFGNCFLELDFFNFAFLILNYIHVYYSLMFFKKNKSVTKKLLLFAKDNYFILIFFAAIGFVAIVSFYKLFVVPPKYVYTRVKVAQGMWWANTNHAPVWLVDGLKKGMADKGLRGNNAEIISVRSYPWWGSNQYDIYLILKLKVNGNKKEGYSFNRDRLVVGAPIELSFPTTEVTGTVTAVSKKKPQEQWVEKTVTLYKSLAMPWEADSIQVGEKYFDGEEVVFEVLAKESKDTTNHYEYPAYTEPRQSVTVKAKIKLQQSKGNWVYGYEQELKKGRSLNLNLPSFQFENYLVADIN